MQPNEERTETAAQRFVRLAEEADTARPTLRLASNAEEDGDGYVFLVAQVNELGNLVLSNLTHRIFIPENVVGDLVKWLTDTFLTPTHKEEI